MSETIADRLALLQGAGKISPIARRATDNLLEAVRDFLGEDLEDSHGIMMATHLALACQRVLDGKAMTDPVPLAEAELAPYERERVEADRLAHRVGSILQAPFPQAETVYLAIHLAARRKGEES
jgi:hypothetical protein